MKTILIITLIYCSITYIESLLLGITNKTNKYDTIRTVLCIICSIIGGLIYYL